MEKQKNIENECVCLNKSDSHIRDRFYPDMPGIIDEIYDSEQGDDFTVRISVSVDGKRKEIRGWLTLDMHTGGVESNEFERIFDLATRGVDISYCPFCGRKL